MEEDIKILENIKKFVEIEFKHYITDRELKALETLLKDYKEIETKKDKETIAKLSYELGKYQEKSKEDEAVIEKLIDERNYIINNLKIDLNKKGVYSQAKGQISEILKYYKLNEKYIFNKSKEKKNNE